jgi:peptidyl-dipeptidase Dcp
MDRFLLNAAAAPMMLALLGGAAPAGEATAGRIAAGPAAARPSANPLLAEWTGPYGGVAPFDKVRAPDFPAAFAASLAERQREIEAIAANRAPATFDNVIVALERAGRAYRRVSSLFNTYTNSMNDEAFQAIERDWAPRLQAAGDAILMNGDLFRRVEAVWNSPQRARLGPEQQRLLWRTRDAFMRSGAGISAAKKARLAAVNQELATLYAEFSQKVLKDEDSWTRLGEGELDGLPESLRQSYRAAAAERDLEGWAVVNTRSSVDPFLTYSSRRDLRERIWRKFKNRGDNGDAQDTNATIARIMPLRAEKAHLLGYPSFAHWKLSDKMAKTPERALALLTTVWRPAAAKVGREVADMQAIADREGGGLRIEPGDYLFYAEKVRRAKYDLDQNALKPYFELGRMIEASQWMAGKLYGLSFREITGKVPVFHPDIRVWEVWEGERFVGLFYGDYFARQHKRSGAWNSAFRPQSKLGGIVTPLVSNNNNFIKGAPGEPVLISLDDARTLFHEFGHALHDLLSNVTYASLAGTSTSTDFTEMPSSVHENWVLTPELLDRFARHYRTGAPLPPEMLARVQAARQFNQGYATGETQAAAIVDMELHRVPDGKIDPDRFERETLAGMGMPPQLAMRHRLPQFNHLFADEDYAAGYYSYLWSETMAADAWAAFQESGDVWSPAVAARLKAMMAAADSVDQEILYRTFRGRDPDVRALLLQRGLIGEGGPAPAPAKAKP